MTLLLQYPVHSTSYKTSILVIFSNPLTVSCSPLLYLGVHGSSPKLVFLTHLIICCFVSWRCTRCSINANCNWVGPSFRIIFCLLIILYLLLKIILQELDKFSFSIVLRKFRKRQWLVCMDIIIHWVLIAIKQSRGSELISCQRAKTPWNHEFSCKSTFIF